MLGDFSDRNIPYLYRFAIKECTFVRRITKQQHFLELKEYA
jgi:hypothetical protein